MRFWIKIQVLRAFIQLVKDPNKTERIFLIGEVARKRFKNSTPPALKDLLENERFLALHREGYNPKIDLQTLRKLPENTFGGSLAKFLDLNGFDPNTFPLIDNENPLAYLVSRLRQTHDIWHVLSGYGTGVQSELALQGFMMSQIGSMISAMIIAAGILHTLIYTPNEMKNNFAWIVEGYDRGKTCAPLALEKWEELFAEDLETVRAKFGIKNPSYRFTLYENGQQSY
jgi:ubiquinone biosynthesis protein COQ4